MLDYLLDEADRLLNSDPGKAQKLAELCADVAEQSDTPATVPRADYILVQTNFASGELSRWFQGPPDAQTRKLSFGRYKVRVGARDAQGLGRVRSGPSRWFAAGKNALRR